MKAKSKQVKIIAICVLVALASLFAFNVTYSYFSATHSINGTIKLSNLKATMIATDKDSNETELTNTTTIYVVNGSDVGLGKAFGISYQSNSDNAYSFGVLNPVDSCNCYVRFWIDAYIVGDTTTNYGQYFVLGNISNQTFTSATTGTNAKLALNSTDKSTYYVKETMEANGETIDFFNAIEISKQAPAELMGKDVQISISFNAIQASNGAVQTWASDQHGKYSSWT